jgi:branched-chain amino acid transport system ATP-binding protein
MLQVSQLQAFYGKSHVLHGVDLQVGDGEIVALLGRNGSGRSTTAKAIMGMVDCQGSVLWKGQQILGRKPYEIANLGLGYVPESRDIFPKLTVHQNLMLGQKRGQKQPRWSFDDMYQLFPRLKEREHTEAGVLSGGEQQMLTLCRTLMGDPDLIIIDEPTEGLAPKIVELVAEYLQALRARGLSVLLIEQKLTIAMQISDRCLVMGHGSIVFDGTPEALR